MTLLLDRTALDSKVDALKPQLVALAEAWVQGGDSAAAKTVEKSQLRLLLQAAKSEPLPVLANLLRYQVGRKKGFYADKDKRKESDKAKVHVRLLKLIEKDLPKLAEAKTCDDESRRQLERELATQLLGFIVREHTYQAAISKSSGTPSDKKHGEERRGKPQQRRKGGKA